MIWLAFLRANWKLLAIIAIAAASYGAIHHYAYQAGYAAADGPWKARFQTAQVELVKARARVVTLEQAQEAITNEANHDLADATQVLEARAAYADGRIHDLVRQLAARPRGCAMPEIPRAAAVPDDSPAGESGADRASISLVDTGRRCEADSSRLALLQGWVRQQRELSLHAAR